MTAPMDAKLCRERFEEWWYGEPGNRYDDPNAWHIWQAASTRTPSLPSEVDESTILAAICSGINSFDENDHPESGINDITDYAPAILKAIRPYLAQGAVKVSIRTCTDDLERTAMRGDQVYPISYAQSGEICKAVILSLKQQNPGVQFDEV